MINIFWNQFITFLLQIYSSETSEARLRGRLGSLPPFLITLGVLFSYVTSGGLHWRTSAFAAIGPSLALGFCMFFVPETPYWMLIKNRHEEAAINLRKLRGPK